MQTRKLVVMSFLTLLMAVLTVEGGSARSLTARSGSHAQAPAGVLEPSVTLRSASGTTIEFYTQNGRTIRGVPPQVLELPYLVVTRNGALTNPTERTLIVSVGDLAVPPGGVTVTLTVETTHRDPGLCGDSGERITVWHEAARIYNPGDATYRDGAVVFHRTFTETVTAGVGRMATPSDYFRVRVAVFRAGASASGPMHIVQRDPGFLMERQAIAPLPGTVQASDAAGPQALVIYYCDMFPFQGDSDEAKSCLPRGEVPAYVETDLLPEMVEAVRVQTEDWGFAWSEAWISYRGGLDAERLSVALSDGETWYHGPAPLDGRAAMAIRVTGGPNAAYDTLTDGLMSTFHHELFHNLQRSIVQELGGHGEVAGYDSAWEFFSEGTAVVASSVAQQAVQFAQSSEPRAYVSRARQFVGSGGFAGDLNSSYEEMIPYHAAMYWRFLHEQCGGLEDARAGMGLIHRALEVLYSGKIADLAPSTDGASSSGLVANLPAIIDAALAGPEAAACPFRTFDDSLPAFSRAIYGLRLNGGRCLAFGVPVGCAFYDPNKLFNAPPVSKLTYAGQELVFGAAEQPYPAGIRSSYGTDFVEVVLDDRADGQPLTLEFHGEPGGRAEFSVELWRLKDDGTGTSWQPSLTPVGPAEGFAWEVDGHLFYTIPEIDTRVYDRLGLIITRLDSHEDQDRFGTYTLELHPGEGGVDRQAGPSRGPGGRIVCYSVGSTGRLIQVARYGCPGRYSSHSDGVRLRETRSQAAATRSSGWV